MIEKILSWLTEMEVFHKKDWENYYIEHDYGAMCAYKRAKEKVQEVAKNGGWIPVQVKLPKESGCYTVTEEMLSLNDRNKVVGTRVAYEVQYDAQNEIWRRANTLRVIAWKPKDTPYQKGE